jgi:hypothetical protein
VQRHARPVERLVLVVAPRWARSRLRGVVDTSDMDQDTRRIDAAIGKLRKS